MYAKGHSIKVLFTIIFQFSVTDVQKEVNQLKSGLKDVEKVCNFCQESLIT